MSEKEPMKVSVSTVFLIIAMIVIAIMGYFMYQFYNEKVEATTEATKLQTQVNDLNGNVSEVQEKTSNSIELELGNYTVNEIKKDEAGVPNVECGVTLKENNDFMIYMGWGAWHSGKYEIKNNQLICTSTLLEWDGGAGPGERETDVIFTFKIINEDKLQLSSIDIKDSNKEKLIYDEGLTVGMTYSKDSIKDKILGTWEASKVVDSNGEDLGLMTVWGSGIRGSNEMIFKENGVLSYMIGITASSEDGEYKVEGNTIKYGVPSEVKGKMNWSTFTYIPEEDVLKEEIEWLDEKPIVTYVRAD